MAEEQQTTVAQFSPRFRTDIYPFIYPSKYRGTLQDKVAIITGAAGALGQALAESFAVAGVKLVLTYNKTAPPPELRERCVRFGAAAVEFVQCNVAELEGCKELVRRALNLHGRVDILVNNAGANRLGPIYVQDPRDFAHDIAVNLNGPYYLMRLLLPGFRAQRSGCVLNIASRAGTVATPYSTSYCASKAALINLTACTQKEMDIEGLDDVHLYSLHPGGIKSAMTLTKYAKKSISSLPASAQPAFLNTLDVYNDSPYLNGMVCVALATGVGKRALRGKYFDVGQDLEDVLAQEEALKANPDLHALHTSFLGELTNAGIPPGGYHAEEVKFEFPGF
ncbi:NAD(P)-binding protein [Parathielavia appendiculata]|uniref:NAD(P)-binding protein n=1 Tax=Parathielavia appendiculata TaxID=2587402 RepID=A0AAN6Z3K5_9PEZI|nr:NAD(P)-binding protein [Parathielavia appendiculata]